MSAISKALDRNRAVCGLAHDLAVKSKSGGGFAGLSAGSFGGMDSFAQQGANRQRYQLFRGWVHSAINALAMRAASQPVQVGRMVSTAAQKPTGSKGYRGVPSNVRAKAPPTIRAKAAGFELEINTEHEVIPSLEHPNNMQHRSQFVYSFVANMCLTGWGFIAVGQGENGKLEFYSLPTTWVQPDHTKGAFAEFKIVNPNDPGSSDAKPLDRTQVAFAQFPNPSDPMSAMSLTQAQQQGIKIDDSIQASQMTLFENGVFPSCIVTVGSNPHPSFPAGVRPRLTAAQRRQVYGAIKKLQSGVANYGNPAIVDGLIEKIERYSSTQPEMGWEKSEKSVRSRILSAFGTHPFMLAEEMPGSYAQAYMVERIFCERINFFLDMLSTLMTSLCSGVYGQEELLVWWEEAVATDPNMERQIWQDARNRGDVSQNEFRNYMGLPPDEDGQQSQIEKSMLQAVLGIAAQVSAGKITPEQGQALLEGAGLDVKLANRIAGSGQANKVDEGGGQVDDGGLMGTIPQVSEEDALAATAQAIDKAISYLSYDPVDITNDMLQGL